MTRRRQGILAAFLVVIGVVIVIVQGRVRNESLALVDYVNERLPVGLSLQSKASGHEITLRYPKGAGSGRSTRDGVSRQGRVLFLLTWPDMRPAAFDVPRGVRPTLGRAADGLSPGETVQL